MRNWQLIVFHACKIMWNTVEIALIKSHGTMFKSKLKQYYYIYVRCSFAWTKKVWIKIKVLIRLDQNTWFE